MNSREERERLKEEYKEHYRSMLEYKKKLGYYERKAKILKALEQMNTAPVMDSLNSVLDKVKEKVALAEARLEMAFDDSEESRKNEEAEEFNRQQAARETLRKVKAEMGVLEDELVKTVEELEKSTAKTVSHKKEGRPEAGHGKIPSDILKTIGPADRTEDHG